ncbi:MAG TPA: 4-hydroxythreonine-4-phosphate dehydrogenase PdxA [Ignavibacteria bacterium]|nr:4-hydroxythreonine-4-phosphate dehydrogenase PdxA [Ignavibacteria bacterium]HRJ98327.1 4-hydroxythreonine-4-phosphate dehydrogenase PdxA [Ignavibacteria bacterium]
MKKSKPKIILTTGDPNGIGPEIILKIFSDKKFLSGYDLYISGHKKIFDFYSELYGIKNIPSDKIIDFELPFLFKITPGKINMKSGKISGDSVLASAKLCIEGKFDAMVTLPLSKEALNLGGYNFPGHTEFLRKITGSDNTVMILSSETFSVALMTGHIPVKNISKELYKKFKSGDLFSSVITINNSLVRDFGIKSPTIGILSLNPHAGDGGLLGKEEDEILMPLIEQMNDTGFKLRGPYASDAYFAGGIYKKFNITAALYHDQGLIPFKMMSFGKGVNFTAGLNIIRTSPDHGTAFDIAGYGKANEESTKYAIKKAALFAKVKSDHLFTRN